jgi:hypothetical protein
VERLDAFIESDNDQLFSAGRGGAHLETTYYPSPDALSFDPKENGDTLKLLYVDGSILLFTHFFFDSDTHDQCLAYHTGIGCNRGVNSQHSSSSGIMAIQTGPTLSLTL